MNHSANVFYVTLQLRITVGKEFSVINSLHAEVIYTFQFSNAEIARNQRCHSEGRC